MNSLKRPPNRQPGLVGQLIRKRREELGISQKNLGQLFEPKVTTQFVSNVERGITPLPPAHIPIVSKALQLHDNELMIAMEKEYALRLAEKLGPGDVAQIHSLSDQVSNAQQSDWSYFKKLYEAYSMGEDYVKREFVKMCEQVLKVPSNLVQFPGKDDNVIHTEKFAEKKVA